VIVASFLALVAAAESRPLFYWGARAAVIAAPALSTPSLEARVLEVHAAQDALGLVLRLTFDRPLRETLHLADGSPVSGRLRAVLYCDSDGDRATGWRAGENDLRRGSEWRLEIGTLAVGADAQEQLEAQSLVTVNLQALAQDGSRHSLWRADQGAAPRQIAVRGEWLELRLPREHSRASARPRLILADGDTLLDGRIPVP